MKKEYLLLREIKRLKSIRGTGTQLISVYIPAGFSIAEEMSRLRDEYSQSSNIKSKTTRNNVLSALDKIMQYLKLFKEVPKNGLAIFCGNISQEEGKDQIELFSIEPPHPLKVNIYRCDSTFLLDPLEEMLSIRESYVLLVMDGREATVATMRGSHIQIVKRHNSTAHAKVKKGGQSARRYERLREESIEDYYKRVSETINSLFEQNNFSFQGLIIGGPGPAKEDFSKGKYLNYRVKILGIYDTGYTDEYGLRELVDKAEELLKEEQATKERKVIEKFKSEVVRDGLATYGYENTLKAVKGNQASLLIIDEELELYRVKYLCEKENIEFEKVEKGNERQKVHECGGGLKVLKESDAIEEIIDEAEKRGISIQMVSEESPYGKEFFMGFGGIGALLKYK
ncbi:MAG: peptide chain release factor aRF-1 [Candidatus Micrarchaeaceae archaeon]